MSNNDSASTATPQMFGHPKGLFYLFFAELWERFSFYGMRALLTLYMVNKLFEAFADRDTRSIIIYASYGSLVYASTVLGGRVSDALLGNRKSIILGGVMMSIGHFVLAIDNQATFFAGLALIIIGTGYFKSNISTFVGTLYEKNDPRQDGGFTIFYMGINIGAFTAPLLCAWLASSYGWHYGFGAAGVGMVLGLVTFVYGSRSGVFGDKGYPLQPEKLEKKWAGLKVGVWVPLLSFAAVPVITLMISDYTVYTIGSIFEGSIVRFFFYVLLIVIIGYLVWVSVKLPREEWQKLVVAVFLTMFMSFFWGFHELSGSIITLFAARNVNLVGMDAAGTNSLNPFFIVVFSMVMPVVWMWLSKKGKNPRTPYKFAMGLAQLGVGFFIISLSKSFADDNGFVPFIFLVVMYLFISTGELFMSPVGLSKITSLSPLKIKSFMMGVWFMSSAFAFQIGGMVGEYLAIESNQAADQVGGWDTLDVYLNGFEKIAYVSFGFALLVVVLSPWLKKWMKEVH
ncbi:peptide MFS transporter [Imperialibacter roseus]|uniref:Peptide MFS transporter n=1 Tax=Imperialibacter roseus TaxID=1324217 RepID=A0ABZ0IWK3_9BACT|nr:peptide MFS transporter [Imperialibacter roseus]WOK08750.1 peptide MFS transporter [Imperialibacter roseus]